jgi:hypothetical protein
MRLGLGGMALLVAAGLGCGSTKSAVPDSGGGLPEVGGTSDAGAPDAADAVTTADADAGVEPRTGRPLPAGVHAPVRLFDGNALLVGNGKTACTHQTPASGDGHRWCAFTVGPAVNGLASLWVIDITRAATGDAPRCDGHDAGCLQLTDKAFVRTAISFEGDTLTYGTDSTAVGNNDFLGRIFAWRPGWSHGRLISSDSGFTCVGHKHSAAAACFDDPVGDPAKRDSANVRAGVLADETGGPLPVFGRYPLRNDNTTTWQADFSPDGSFFLLSSAEAAGARQTLRIVPTAKVGQTAPAVIADAAFWQVSNDGQKVYFLRNLHNLDQLGDLYLADFPSGANPELVESDLKQFVVVGDRPSDQALQLWKNHPPGGTIELLSNRAMVAPKTIFTHDDFLNGAVLSPDLRFTTWLNDPFRAVVYRNGDLATCDINGPDDPPVSGVSYLAHSSLMFWKEEPPGSQARRDAFYAPPENCAQKTQFAHHVDLISAIDDRGLVFSDELGDGSPGATLKYIGATAGGLALDPAGPVRIQENVLGTVVFVGANPPLLVYSAQTGSGGSADASRLFVFGPVPF